MLGTWSSQAIGGPHPCRPTANEIVKASNVRPIQGPDWAHHQHMCPVLTLMMADIPTIWGHSWPHTNCTTGVDFGKFLQVFGIWRARTLYKNEAEFDMHKVGFDM
jgi:hypothetical protein